MIRVVDLYKSFGGQQVLKGINLEVETGKITTIIGGSGSGKTVLLKHLNALLLPDRGSVLVDETDITKLGENALKKRAGLARALVIEPEIILFDEPTTGLDPLLGKSIHELIRKMHNTFGFTGVMVSHDIPEVFKISDRVAMLANGVIAEVGPTEQF